MHINRAQQLRRTIGVHAHQSCAAIAVHGWCALHADFPAIRAAPKVTQTE
jgi:hypothetical protein